MPLGLDLFERVPDICVWWARSILLLPFTFNTHKYELNIISNQNASLSNANTATSTIVVSDIKVNVWLQMLKHFTWWKASISQLYLPTK